MDLYREHETLSVSEIARLIKLSRTTVMKINEELLEKGIITDAGKGDSTEEGGKRPAIFQFNADRNLILTFHIKYDSVEFRLSDLKYQNLIEDTETINMDDPFPLIAQKMRVILDRHKNILSDGGEILACLIAIHGNVDPKSGICIHSTYFPSWGTYANLNEIVLETLQLECPIHLDTWTRYKVYGESKLGCARGYETIVLIDAGWHGINSGILLDGEVYTGKHYLSGEIGHIKVNRDDTEPCTCGSRGCLEQQLSLKRLKGNINQLKDQYTGSGLTKLKENALTLHSILESADSGDPLARHVLDEAIGWLALSISHIVMFFDPELILIEGDYACDCGYFESTLLDQVKKITLPRLSIRNTEIRFNNTTSIPPLKGAAAFGVDTFYSFE